MNFILGLSKTSTIEHRLLNYNSSIFVSVGMILEDIVPFNLWKLVQKRSNVAFVSRQGCFFRLYTGHKTRIERSSNLTSSSYSTILKKTILIFAFSIILMHFFFIKIVPWENLSRWKGNRLFSYTNLSWLFLLLFEDRRWAIVFARFFYSFSDFIVASSDINFETLEKRAIFMWSLNLSSLFINTVVLIFVQVMVYRWRSLLQHMIIKYL